MLYGAGVPQAVRYPEIAVHPIGKASRRELRESGK